MNFVEIMITARANMAYQTDNAEYELYKLASESQKIKKKSIRNLKSKR